MVNREDCLIVKVMMVMIVMMSVTHHSSADLATLLQLTATSVIERPERAALEPPTVTSLKPPDRTKSNRGAGGTSVQSEQSGSHIPPVVASRSPSSSSFSRNYNSRYLHHNPRSNQPAAPVATASSSGSRPGHQGKIDGRRDPSENHHQFVPIPTPHLVNGTSVSIPQDSSWVPPVSFAPLPPPPPPPPRNTHMSSGYAPIAGSYPRHSRIPTESETFETKHQERNKEKPNLPSVGGGVWGESDHSSAEGMWQETRRRPYPQDHLRPYEHSFTEDSVRSDTFGHHLSEDLSHLSSEYSPRRGSSRRGHPQPPGQSPDIFHPHRNSHPSGRNIHRIDIHHRFHEDDASDFRTEDTSSPEAPAESSGSAPTSYSPSPDGEKTQNSPVHPRLYASAVDSGDTRKPLTLYEVWHMVNMSNWEEFVEFLKNKGLSMSQVLSYMNEGATKQDFLKLFAKPNVSPTSEASSSSSSPSTSDIHQTNEKVTDTLQGESFLHSVTDSGRFLRTTTSRKVQEELDVDGDDEDEENDEESKSTAPKGKRKNRRKGKNKKNKGRNGEKNKRKRGRNHDKPVVPDFTYTTVTFPIDNVQHNDTQSSKADSFGTVLPTTPLFQGQSTQSVPTQHSTRLTLPEYSPDLDLSEETSEADSWPKSSFVSPTTPIKAILPPTATTPVTPTFEDTLSPIHRASELDKAARTTPLPRSKGPKAGSLTLPPTSKPSEVSIISFTVMEVPFQAVPEETVLEDIKPLKRQKNYRSPPKTTEETFPKRTYSSTKLLPTMTSNKMNDEPVLITPYMREESKDKYTFPVKGFMIITGVMGALAVFTLVVLISYAIVKCSKQPVVNNYQVSEQKTSATQQS